LHPRLAIELARRGFRRHATYRAATVAGIFTNTIFGLIRGSILLAALAAADGPIGGYDRSRVLAYVWLGQALIGPIAIFRWTEIAERIRTGELASDLSRPADFQGWWLFDDLGRGLYQIVARGAIQFAIGALLVDLLMPDAPWRWAALAFSVLLAVVISFGLRFLANLWVFWTLDARGPLMLYTLLGVSLSGFVVPLDFFPSWLAAVQRALPFAGMVQGPIDVYLGTRSALSVLAMQVLWAVALLVAGRALLVVATRRLVVQGG